MGYVHAQITLKNPRLPKLKPLVTQSLVDTGALTLCIPEHIAVQLKLESNAQREITLADGRQKKVLHRLLLGEDLGTFFLPVRAKDGSLPAGQAGVPAGKKNWLSHFTKQIESRHEKRP